MEKCGNPNLIFLVEVVSVTMYKSTLFLVVDVWKEFIFYSIQILEGVKIID
jgi:hypothetical protein